MIVELQKALDKFPNPDFSLDDVGTQMRVLLYDEWLKDFKEKFVVFQRELEDERKCNEIKMGAMLKALEKKHREVEGKISVDKKQLSELEDWIIGKHWGDFDPELVFILEKIRKVLGK